MPSSRFKLLCSSPLHSFAVNGTQLYQVHKCFWLFQPSDHLVQYQYLIISPFCLLPWSVPVCSFLYQHPFPLIKPFGFVVLYDSEYKLLKYIEKIWEKIHVSASCWNGFQYLLSFHARCKLMPPAPNKAYLYVLSLNSSKLWISWLTLSNAFHSLSLVHCSQIKYWLTCTLSLSEHDFIFFHLTFTGATLRYRLIFIETFVTWHIILYFRKSVIFGALAIGMSVDFSVLRNIPTVADLVI